jgi:hypothetical protein
VVVDGGYGNVDDGGPVGLVPARRTVHEKQPLDEVPPHRVQLRTIRIGVECLLEVVHDKHETGEDHPVCPAVGGELI